jgi:uncharacterized protein YbaR (Trm112 family)
MKSQWDKIKQNKSKMNKLDSDNKEFGDEVNAMGERIKEILDSINAVRFSTPEEIQELSKLWSKYHAKKSMQSINMISLNVLGMTASLSMEKMMSLHHLVCPDDEMQLIPQGYFSEITMPKGSDFDNRTEFDEAVKHYDECMKNYSEFAKGKTPEELVKIKGYFVCPDCGKVYKIEHVGSKGRENSRVVKLYNAIKKELSS